MASLGLNLPAQAYTPVQRTQFNIPEQAGGTTAEQLVYLTSLRQAIDATPQGEVIRVSTYSFYSPPVLEAFLRAQERGVKIHFLTHEHAMSTGQAKKLQQALGGDLKAASWFKVCVGSCARGGTRGSHHSKLVTFSRVKDGAGRDVRYVTLLSSGNIGEFAGTSQWNSFQTIVDLAVYNSARRYIDALAADRDTFDYPGVTSGRYQLSYLPHRALPVDPVLDALKATSSAKGCRIRLAMYVWSGSRIAAARRLAALKAHGCDIEVAIARDTANADVLAVLKAAKIPTYDTQTGGGYMHGKATVIHGKVDGVYRDYVYTGSMNFTYSATHTNSETLLRISSAATVTLYSAWFDRVIASSGVRRIS